MSSLKESGNYHYKSQNFNKAKQYYLKSLSENPADSAVHHNLSMTYFQLQKYDDAYKHCSMALEIDPKYVKALFRRIKICSKQGKFLEGIIDGQRYLELQTNETSQITKEIEDMKAKLRQGNPTPPQLLMFNNRRQAVPPIVNQINSQLSAGTLDAQSLRKALKNVQDVSSNSYNITGLEKIDALKKQLYTCLLQVEEDANKIDILDILMASATNKQEKQSWLWTKVRIAKTNKWDDLALSALHELRYYSTKKKEVQDCIQSILVPQVDDEEEKEQTQAPLSVNLTQSTIVVEDSITNTDSAKNTDIDVVDEVLKEEIKKKLKKLSKLMEFDDLVWILQSLKDSKNKQLRQATMLEMSNLTCLDCLMSGCSQQEKSMLRELIVDMPENIKKKFKL